MSKTVEISDKLHAKLEKCAFGFHQTPSAVIENICHAFERHCADVKTIQNEKKYPYKFLYNNSVLDKSRLVHTIISDYLAMQEDEINLYQLNQAFPNSLQGELGIAQTYYEVARRYDGETNKYFFLDENDLLDLQDGKVAIVYDWNAITILGFVEHAQSLGFQIKQIDTTANHGSDEKTTDSSVLQDDSIAESELIERVLKEFVSNARQDIKAIELTTLPSDSSQSNSEVNRATTAISSNNTDLGDRHHSEVQGEKNSTNALESALTSERSSERVLYQKTQKRKDTRITQRNAADNSVQRKPKKRKGKYSYKQKDFNAAQLVLEIVSDYVSNQQDVINLNQLAEAFPNDLQGPIGVANKLDEVLVKYHGRMNHLHFTNEKYLLNLQEGKVAVSTEWRKSNTAKFIDRAGQLGFVVEVNS